MFRFTASASRGAGLATYGIRLPNEAYENTQPRLLLLAASEEEEYHLKYAHAHPAATLPGSSRPSAFHPWKRIPACRPKLVAKKLDNEKCRTYASYGLCAASLFRVLIPPPPLHNELTLRASLWRCSQMKEYSYGHEFYID